VIKIRKTQRVLEELNVLSHKTGCRIVHWLLTLYLLAHGNRSNDYLIAQLNAEEIFSNVTLDIW